MKPLPPVRSRILLVEDDPVVRKVTSSLLVGAGHEVIEAETGEEGLRLVREQPPDLVLMDVFLPGISGIDAVRTIKADPELDSVIVVNLSARFTTPEDQAAGLDAGADGYIIRPISTQELLARVNAFLRQKRMADALRESRRQLANAQRIAHLGSWELDIEANHLVWSDEVYRIFDRSRTEFEETPQAFLQFVHPDDRQGLWDARQRAIAGSGSFEYEHRIVGRHGDVRHVHERGELMVNNAGRSILCGTVQDVTDRRRAEQQARRLAERLSTTLESITDAFCTIDREWRFTYTNQGAERLMQRGREDLIGRNIWEVFPDAVGSNFEKAYRRALAEKRTVTVVEPYAPFGLLLELRIYPSDEGLAVYFRDVTEERRTAHRLHEQASLLDKAQDAIFARDLNHNVTYWNQGAERLYGWSAGEAVGRRTADLIRTDQDAEAVESAVKAVLGTGEWMGELHRKTKTGEAVIVEARWTLVRNAAGRPEGILSIETGVTERKQLEQQVLRAQRMESIGTLAGGIAHDLNNVLTPITLGVQMLLESVDSAEDREILTLVAQSAARGTDMVAHVLAFARGEEGRRLPIAPFQLIRDVERITRDTFPKNIEMEVVAPEGLWSLTGDQTQLHQVLLNLCLNARDAMPEGGRLTVRAVNLALDEQQAARDLDARAGRYVRIEVTDVGVGIHPRIIDRIFDPFFTTKPVGKGTGLGLPTSRTIVRSHGGFIEARSDVGAGSTFSIYLPADAEAGNGQGESAGATLPRGRGETVLVIDDEAAVRQLASRILKGAGYRVWTAADGAEAVAVYREHHASIDVVLTDMMMPVMDGPATIAALIAIDPDVRFVATSGIPASYPLGSDAGKAVKEFLPKPYSVDALLTTLRRVLERPS